MGNVLQNVLPAQPAKYGVAFDQLSQAMTIHNITGGKYKEGGATTSMTI